MKTCYKLTTSTVLIPITNWVLRQCFFMVSIFLIKQLAERHKRSLVCKSGKKHIKEIRVWQKQAIDDFVDLIVNEYEIKRPRF